MWSCCLSSDWRGCGATDVTGRWPKTRGDLRSTQAAMIPDQLCNHHDWGARDCWHEGRRWEGVDHMGLGCKD